MFIRPLAASRALAMSKVCPGVGIPIPSAITAAKPHRNHSAPTAAALSQVKFEIPHGRALLMVRRGAEAPLEDESTAENAKFAEKALEVSLRR